MSLDPFTAAFDLGKIAIEKIWPDANKRATEMRKLEEMKQAGDLAQLNAHVQLLQGQMAINSEEAKHKSVFIAGWRPCCGWIGAISLAYASIIDPLMRFVATMSGYEGAFPVIDTSLNMQILMGMLGIAGMRSFDKLKGTETLSIK